MGYRHYEIRPCVEDNTGATCNFVGEQQWSDEIGDYVCTAEAALAAAEEYRAKYPGCGDVFWTLYGHDGEELTQAIGDFVSFASAMEVMNSILAPMAEARDAIRTGDLSTALSCADDLDDIINQSTNELRL